MQAHVARSPHFAATYVLLQYPESADALELEARYAAAATYDSPVIALAIEPEAREALPALSEALGGSGAPAGVLRAEVRADALLLEFVCARGSWKLIQRLIETELVRFGSTTRTTTLLSPLTLELEAQIASECLQCPEIAPDRVLEALTADANR